MNNTIPADQVSAWVLLSNFEYGLPDDKTPLLGPFEKGIRNPKSIASLPFEELDAGHLGKPVQLNERNTLKFETIWIVVETFAAYWFTHLLAPSVVHAHHPPNLDLSAMGCGASAQPAAATTEQSPKDAWVLKWHVEWKGDLLT